MKPELISPVQDFVSLTAAINAKADAVYFGLKEFSMRANAKNFNVSELKKVAEICHKNKIKAYLTINTIVYENEIEKIKNILKKVKEAEIDAIHAWDMSVIKEALKLGIEVHLSTQASVSNSEAALFYKKLGIKRIILARECNLKQIKEIKKKVKGIEIETFIHGAMCVSVSGRCFISQFLFNKSANRGECLQPCRRRYYLEDVEEGHRLELGNDYVMSPKDLCALPFIEKLIEIGIDAFKIEGRNRSPEYVKIVTEVYRAAIDFYFANKHKKDFKTNFEALKKQLLEELKSVYNRGFSPGFYIGLPTNEDWAGIYGSKATAQKVYVGKIIHFYNKINVAEVKIETGKISIGDKIMIQGPTTGVYEQKVESMEVEHKKINEAKKGDVFAIKLQVIARKSDKVFIVKKT
jgi:putative protease